MESQQIIDHGNEEQIDLLKLIESLWKEKAIILSCIVVSALASVLFALSTPNIYQATALLRPQASESSKGVLARQYGGLANLAGISLPSGDGQSKTLLALEVLKSKKFAYEFSQRHGILPALFAAKSWSAETGEISFDSSIYEPESQTWTRDVPPYRSPAPTPQETHEIWQSSVIAIENKDTGFIELRVEHISPLLAKRWIDLLVVDLNESLRHKDLAESERAVNYLEGKLKETNIAEIRELLSGLLRSHMESRMMATVEPDYAFSVIDPALIPEQKIAPNRALISALGALFGGALGVVIARIKIAAERRYSKNRTQEA